MSVVRGKGGNTALHSAAEKNSAEAMGLLLAAKVSVDIRNRYVSAHSADTAATSVMLVC